MSVLFSADTEDPDLEVAMTQLEISMKDRPHDRTLTSLADQASEARVRVDSAQQRLAEAEREHDFWRQLASHWASGRAATVLLVLRESGDLIHRLSQARESSASLIEQLQREAEAKAKDNVRGFGRSFPDRVREAEFGKRYPIDSTSRHPTYTFANGFLKVEVDEKRSEAKIAPRDGDVIRIGLDTDYVVERVGAELRRLFNRKFEPESFLKSVYTAYLAVVRSENRPDGDEVPLRRVSNRMAKNMNRFSSDEFNVDLARIIREGKVDTEGRRLHLNHTRNARQGMLLHGLEEGGYVGFISFKRDS